MTERTPGQEKYSETSVN